MSSIDGKKSDILLVAGLFLSIVLSLIIVPGLIPNENTHFISAAAEVGYNTPVAYWTVLGWSVIVCLVFAWPSLRLRFGIADHVDSFKIRNEVSNQQWQPGRLIWWEIAVVFVVFMLAYLPTFLAGYGPYIEDGYFLVTLQRMDCGQIPYADFGFLYGPLMIYPLWAWTQWVGTSLYSYFSFISLIEGLQFALLMAALQYLVPSRKQRYWIFLLLLPFLLNTLLGLNYNGLRRLVPAFVIIAVALWPFQRKVIIVSAVILGLVLAYSHEYGIAALLSLVGIYGVAFIGGARVASCKSAATVIVLAIAVWLGTLKLLLGDATSAYFASMAEVVEMMSKGHAGFKFYWTLNSLSLFGLLAIAISAFGKGLFKGRTEDFLPGDYLLVGAVVYALVMLKSGLTRADLWHLDAGFIALFIVMLVSLPSKIMVIDGVQKRIGIGLIAMASFTYLVGIAPSGSLYAMSYVKGVINTVAGHRVNTSAPTRTTSLEIERAEPRADFIDMGSYLAAPARIDQPVLFYGQAWPIALQVGVCSADYKLDDLMYSEFRRPERIFLQKNPNALIVIRQSDYNYIFDRQHYGESVSQMPMTPTKKLGRWLSTVHYGMAEVEGRLQREARWNLTGKYLPDTYQRVVQFGDYVVLEPKK